MRAAHLCSGLLAPMLSFDPAVQDCGEVSLSLSVSEPKSAADTFLLDMVVRDTAFSPILMPFHNKTRESVAQCKLDFLVAENVTLTFRGFKKILNPWWLNRRGNIIGGWVEVDRWLQNFCSVISRLSKARGSFLVRRVSVVAGFSLDLSMDVGVSLSSAAPFTGCCCCSMYGSSGGSGGGGDFIRQL